MDVSGDSDLEPAPQALNGPQAQPPTSPSRPPNPPRAGQRQKVVRFPQSQPVADPATTEKRRAHARDIWTFVELNESIGKNECIFCRYSQTFIFIMYIVI